MFCKNCGKELDDKSDVCLNCGCFVKEQAPAVNVNTTDGSIAKKGWFLAIMCCIGFFFVAGIHRFLVGKIGTGILWLLTGGCFFIGTIVDLIMILSSSFTDKDGKVIPLGA